MTITDLPENMTKKISSNQNHRNPGQLKKILYTGFVLILTASSCNSVFEKDHSYTSEEYQRLGMPDHRKVWTNDDYINANITLSSLKMNDPLSLPRKKSKKSGELFNRMVNEKNLDFIYDTIFPLRTVAYTIQYYTQFQTQMEQMYTIEHKGKIYYSEELLDLHIFSLLIHDRMLELGQIIERSDDEDVEGIKSGLQAVKFNYLKLIPRLLDEVSKTRQYSVDGIDRLTKAISASLIKNQEWMTSGDKDNLESELKNAVK